MAMNQGEATRNVTVTNRAGLHARAALLIAKCARGRQARVELVLGSQRADATDMLQVLSLGAAQGTRLILQASGPEAETTLDALEELFAAGFHEEDET